MNANPRNFNCSPTKKHGKKCTFGNPFNPAGLSCSQPHIASNGYASHIHFLTARKYKHTHSFLFLEALRIRQHRNEKHNNKAAKLVLPGMQNPFASFLSLSFCFIIQEGLCARREIYAVVALTISCLPFLGERERTRLEFLAE